MTVLADSLTLGAYVGYFFFAVAVLLILGGTAFAVIFVRGRDNFIGWSAFWTTLAGLLILVITLVAMWPLEYPYHHWVDKRGVVSAKNSRIIPAGDHSVQQRIVLVVNGQPYGVDDTRAALVNKGDRVHLRCKKDHQFMQPHSADGWACRWGGAA
jgi:hypothetical protein